MGLLSQGGLQSLEAWRAVLPPDVVLVRLLSPRCVHLRLADAPVCQDVVIKAVLAAEATGLRRLAEVVEGSKAHRSYLWAHRMRALGIETPRPLGYLERAKAPGRHISFVGFEHVGAPNLIQVRDELGMMPLEQKRALVQRVAVLLRELHQKGVFHADLHAGNILVGEDQLWVVDLESVRSFSLPGRATMKNLVRLNRDFLDRRVLTRSDRLRFLSVYLAHEADAAAQRRRLWSKVLKTTERKLDQRGEAFHGAT